jgi:hypothetical protein
MEKELQKLCSFYKADVYTEWRMKYSKQQYKITETVGENFQDYVPQFSIIRISNTQNYALK